MSSFAKPSIEPLRFYRLAVLTMFACLLTMFACLRRCDCANALYKFCPLVYIGTLTCKKKHLHSHLRPLCPAASAPAALPRHAVHSPKAWGIIRLASHVSCKNRFTQTEWHGTMRDTLMIGDDRLSLFIMSARQSQFPSINFKEPQSTHF